MSCVLVFDLGTTYFKAALFDDQGDLHALARRRTPYTTHHDERREIDPARFDDAIDRLAHDLQDASPEAYEHIQAVSFSSQANSLLLMGPAGRPLTPIVVWNDPRELGDGIGAAALTGLPDRYERTGVPVVSHQLAALRLRWLRSHDPDSWASARRFCLISEYLTFRLTGEHVSEPSLASLTGLLDVRYRQWWPPAAEAVDVPRQWLAELIDPGRVVAPLTPAAKQRLGLSGDVAMVMGCLDQYAGAIAAGNVSPGRVSETTGTVLAVVSCHDRFDPALEQRGIWQGPTARHGLYYRMAFSEVSANTLDAFRESNAPDQSVGDLIDQAAELDANPPGVRLNLEATAASGRPVFDREPVSKAEGVYAIMQAVAERLTDHLEALRTEQPTSEVICLGGGAKSAFWRRLKERASGVPMRVLPTEEPTCRGAAVCAVAGLTHRPVHEVAAAWSAP
ncbi:MAG: FGGY-family carbohydrate kinase [Planctomycetota bacterium]